MLHLSFCSVLWFLVVSVSVLLVSVLVSVLVVSVSVLVLYVHSPEVTLCGLTGLYAFNKYNYIHVVCSSPGLLLEKELILIYIAYMTW